VEQNHQGGQDTQGAIAPKKKKKKLDMSISPSKKKVFQNLVTLNRGTNFPQIVKLNMKSMPLEKTPP
jgi:hypothetical protein